MHDMCQNLTSFLIIDGTSPLPTLAGCYPTGGAVILFADYLLIIVQETSAPSFLTHSFIISSDSLKSLWFLHSGSASNNSAIYYGPHLFRLYIEMEHFTSSTFSVSLPLNYSLTHVLTRHVSYINGQRNTHSYWSGMFYFS